MVDFTSVKHTQSLPSRTHPQESFSVSQQGDELSDYHPVLVEGMGAYDQRDPLKVAQQVCRQLGCHWVQQPPTKPLILLTQVTPSAPRASPQLPP